MWFSGAVPCQTSGAAPVLAVVLALVRATLPPVLQSGRELVLLAPCQCHFLIARREPAEPRSRAAHEPNPPSSRYAPDAPGSGAAGLVSGLWGPGAELTVRTPALDADYAVDSP